MNREYQSLEWREGYTAYGEGDTYCPYLFGSDEYKQWQSGFDAARSDDLLTGE